MTNWSLFDSNCMIGRHSRLGEGMPYSSQDLLSDMDHHGIAEALVLDCLSHENHPEEGNRRVLVMANNPRLHPAWAALPPGTTDEQPAPEELLRQMRQARVGALVLFTASYAFNLSDWCIDALLAPMAESRVPVFINPNEWSGQDNTEWNEVVALCKRWPTLPVIVSEARIRRSQRLVYRALDACPNLHIETSGWWLHHGIEYITGRWGAERLIFGSNWPKYGQHMSVATLACAEISDEDKRKIGGENLRQLLKWCDVKHPQVESTPAADEYVAFGRSDQRTREIRITDCHGHLGGRAPHYHLPDCDLDSIVHEMDRLGVEKTCVFSFAGIFSDEVYGNDVVANAVRRYPDHFVGFAMVNPHRGRDAMLRELDRCEKLGLRHIKLIPYYQGYPEDGELIDVPCQWAHDHKRIILNHGWGSPQHMQRLISAYPDACYFTGHTTLNYAEIMKQFANLYVCSCPLNGPRMCETVVQAIGADRLLFGSDLQDLPIAWGLGPILFARIPTEQKALILGGNLRRILAQYDRA